MRTALLVLLVAVPALGKPPKPVHPHRNPDPSEVPIRGETRIDMETLDLKGQRPAYGAVQLFARKDLHVRSMVKTPDNFRDEISF